MAQVARGTRNAGRGHVRAREVVLGALFIITTDHFSNSVEDPSETGFRAKDFANYCYYARLSYLSGQMTTNELFRSSLIAFRCRRKRNAHASHDGKLQKIGLSIHHSSAHTTHTFV